jgi:hypothetical protein
MEKIRENSGRLEFRSYPLKDWLVVVFLLSVWFWYAFFVENITLICTRTQKEQGSCQLFKTALLKPQPRKITEFSLASLQYADVDDKGSCYQIHLYLKEVREPLRLSNCMRSRHEEYLRNKVLQIHSFMTSDTETSLRVQEMDLRVFAAQISPLIGLALWILFSNGRLVIATFDKTTGEVALQRLGLWRAKALNYQISEIVRVKVVAKEPFFFKGSYRLSLVLRSQQKIPIAANRELKESNRRNLQASCDRINHFLHAQSNTSERY